MTGEHNLNRFFFKDQSPHFKVFGNIISLALMNFRNMFEVFFYGLCLWSRLFISHQIEISFEDRFRTRILFRSWK